MVWLASDSDSLQSLPVGHCKQIYQNQNCPQSYRNGIWRRKLWMHIDRHALFMGIWRNLLLPFRCQGACLYIGASASFILIFEWNRWFVVIVCASLARSIVFAEIICVQAIYADHWERSQIAHTIIRRWPWLVALVVDVIGLIEEFFGENTETVRILGICWCCGWWERFDAI